MAVIALAVVACGARPVAPTQAPDALPALAPPSPGTREVVTSDGVKLYVKVSGRGPVCMFFHGGPGQDTLSFEKMGGDALEAFTTMVYVDQRGSGKSAEAANYHLDRVVQDFEEVRRALGVDTLCLIGHSFGGILAVAYAKQHPAHVSALVMANATLQFLAPRQRLMQARFINELLNRPAEQMPAEDDAAGVAAAHETAWRALMKSDKGFRVLADTWPTVKKMNEIESSYERSRGYGREVFDERAALPEYYADYAPMSAQIAQPVLVIAGTRDYAVGPDEHKRFRFPHQQVVLLEGGHMPYHDANAGFTAAIRDFLAGLAARGSAPTRGHAGRRARHRTRYMR